MDGVSNLFGNLILNFLDLKNAHFPFAPFLKNYRKGAKGTTFDIDNFVKCHFSRRVKQ